MIGGRFTLVAPIGRGSMGTVHEAYDEHLHRRVALNRLSFVDDLARRRFRREARLTARLNHPGVPAIYDLGDDYIAMEYVDGHPLQDVIAEAAPLPDAWVAAIGLQIAAVLVCAHRVSLIHRDLKPSNVLLTSSGAVKVIDFGVATLVGDESLSTLTPPGVVVGTASYQAPECQYGLAGPRSDIYSLGRILADLGCAVDPSLTATDPQDRPASAFALLPMLRPLLALLPPLPTFVPDPARTRDLTEAYLTLANASTDERSGPFPPRQARAEAERLVVAGRYEDAIAILEASIAATHDDELELDIRRDLTRILVEHGDTVRAVAECDALIPRLTAPARSRSRSRPSGPLLARALPGQPRKDHRSPMRAGA